MVVEARADIATDQAQLRSRLLDRAITDRKKRRAELEEENTRKSLIDERLPRLSNSVLGLVNLLLQDEKGKPKWRMETSHSFSFQIPSEEGPLGVNLYVSTDFTDGNTTLDITQLNSYSISVKDLPVSLNADVYPHLDHQRLGMAKQGKPVYVEDPVNTIEEYRELMDTIRAGVEQGEIGFERKD